MTIGADLIRQAYILAKVLDPEEELEAYQVNQGLTSLNAIIEQWSSLQIYIPSYRTITINMIPGVYRYTVTPVITQVLQGHYMVGNQQYWLQPIDLKRQNTLNYTLGQQARTLPETVFVDDSLPEFMTECTVYFYPVPAGNYVATLYVKQRIGKLDKSTEIGNIPAYMEKLLIYQLALDTAAINATVLTKEFYDEYDRLDKELKAANKQDMTVLNQNPFRGQRQFRPWSRYA